MDFFVAPDPLFKVLTLRYSFTKASRRFFHFFCSETPVKKIIFRYLASGCSFADLHYSYRLGRTTISEIVQEVCESIWINLKIECLSPPTTESWLDIAQGFESRANFPHIIGAIDGKHIRVIKPANTGTLYYNYKHFFSIVLLAVCDSNYKFTYVDIGAYGKCSDSSVFKDSGFYKNLMNGNCNIPDDAVIEGIEGQMPYFLVGDEAFSLSNHILRPFAGNNLTRNKRIFNYRLSRARRYIECTFGILANKWRIFHRPINVNIKLAVSIVKACCILHNFVRERHGVNFEQTLHAQHDEGLEDIPRGPVQRASRSVINNRNLLADYFLNANMLPWQDRFT